jgi:hypothetical protein
MICDDLETVFLLVVHLAASAVAIIIGYRAISADMRRWLGRRKVY